jgi:hypothetical protein
MRRSLRIPSRCTLPVQLLLNRCIYEYVCADMFFSSILRWSNWNSDSIHNFSKVCQHYIWCTISAAILKRQLSVRMNSQRNKIEGYTTLYFFTGSLTLNVSNVPNWGLSVGFLFALCIIHKLSNIAVINIKIIEYESLIKI